MKIYKMEKRTIGEFEFLFKAMNGWFEISTIREDIKYVVRIRKREKSAFEDFKDHKGGLNGASYFKGWYNEKSGYIRLWYSADVGRCCTINLYRNGEYSQDFYFNRIDYDYTHDWMEPTRYKIRKQIKNIVNVIFEKC